MSIPDRSPVGPAGIVYSPTGRIGTSTAHSLCEIQSYPGLILGMHPANERRRYKVTASLIGWAQA